MSRALGWLAVVALGVPAWAAAQTGQSLVEDLDAVYTARCLSEVEELAHRLTAMDKDVRDKMPKAEAQSVREAVNQAWKNRDLSIALFRQLLDSPRKFTRWAAEERLPAWFKVPDSAAEVRRWEALRPILATVAPGDRLAWDREDISPWKEQQGAWRLELLLLLRWLDPVAGTGPPGARDGPAEWAEAQSGIAWVRLWCDSPGQNYQMLHGQYRYTVLPRRPSEPGLPRKLIGMLERVAWSGKGDLNAYLKEKEALLADLLPGEFGAEDPHAGILPAPGKHASAKAGPTGSGSGVGGSQSNSGASPSPAAAAWFEAAARSFPPLSAFEPDWDAQQSVIRATYARKNTQFAGMMDRLRAAGASSRLSNAVLWYQSQMHTDGRLTFPEAGWSSWVRDQPAQAAPLTPSASQERHVAGAEGAWHDICAWMAPRLAQSAGDRPVRLTIRSPLGWTFAFRADELQEVAERRAVHLKFSQAGSAVPLDAVLSIVRVDPNHSIGVELRADGKIVDTTDFQIPGPWRPWLASRRFPMLTSVWTWLALIVFGGVLRWSRTQPADLREEKKRKRAVRYAVAAGLAMAVAAACDGPRPAASPELGGAIELALPLHAASPPGMRQAVTRISAAVYRRLSELNEDDQRPVRVMRWWERWWYALRRWVGFPADPKVSVQRDGVTQLEYRVVPSVFGDGSAQLVGHFYAAGTPDFERLIAGLSYRGEPDVPSSLLYGPPPGTRLVVNLSDGDHGGVRPPAAPDWDVSLFTILSVALATPTRDIRADHGLLIDQRRAWLKRRSTYTVSLRAGFADSLRAALPPLPRPADVSARAPEDMDQQRAEFWDPALLPSASLDAAAGEIAARAVEMVKRPRAPLPQGSHTVLRLLWSWPRFGVLVLALVMLAHAFHLGTLGASFGEWPVLGRLVLETSLAALALPALLLPGADSLFSSLAWTYGDGLLDGIAAVRTWILWLAVALVAVRAWYVLEQKLFGRHQTFSAVYSFHLRAWLAAACGFWAVALALTFWVSAPVRDLGAGPWLPANYAGTVMAGLTLWCGGIFLVAISTRFRSKNRKSYAPFSGRTPRRRTVHLGGRP